MFEDIVHMQLKPGTQYIIDVPNPAPSPDFGPSSTSHHPASTVERNFSCNVCGLDCRDNFNLRIHIERVHTVKEDGFLCARFFSFYDTYVLTLKFQHRSWCNIKFSTAYDLKELKKLCAYNCSVPGCSKGPLTKSRDIQRHINFHLSQQAKMQRLAYALES